MRLFSDTWTMTKRSLSHIVRSPDTIITVVAMPVALMLMFVYVFGGSFGQMFRTGPVKYIDFIVPGVVAMTVVSGIAYAAVRLSMDLQRGMVQPISYHADRVIFHTGRSCCFIIVVQPVLGVPCRARRLARRLPVARCSR